MKHALVLGESLIGAKTFIVCIFILNWFFLLSNCVSASDNMQMLSGANNSFHSKNLLFNSSFECGVFGWGTLGVDKLYGEIDTSTAAQGRQSLRIELSGEKVPVYYNDFSYSLKGKAAHYRVFKLPVSSVGYVPVTAGKTYTFLRLSKSRCQPDTSDSHR